MSEEGPKLYTNKPKKAQLKQSQVKGKDFTLPPSSSSSSKAAAAAAAASYTMGSQGGSAPPPPPPKESFARRYKFLWPLLLTVNLAVGGYIFLRTNNKKETSPPDEETAPPSNPAATTAPSAVESTLSSLAASEPVKVREPMPEKQQRELFKWMLEEKRNVKTKDAEEKKRINEEKAILKQFIRAKSIPTL